MRICKLIVSITLKNLSYTEPQGVIPTVDALKSCIDSALVPRCVALSLTDSAQSLDLNK